jgi:hypothetical protein
MIGQLLRAMVGQRPRARSARAEQATLPQHVLSTPRVARAMRSVWEAEVVKGPRFGPGSQNATNVEYLQIKMTLVPHWHAGSKKKVLVPAIPYPIPCYPRDLWQLQMYLWPLEV